MMSEEKFQLQWHCHSQILISNLQKLLIAKEFVDVTLVSEGHQIACHRLVLSACSGFFDSILQGMNNKYPIIILPTEVKLWHMQGLVNYMYLGQVTVAKAGLTDFLKSAKILKIRGLYDVLPDNKINIGENKNDVKSEKPVESKEADTNCTLNSTTENSTQDVSTTTSTTTTTTEKDTPTVSISSTEISKDTIDQIKVSAIRKHTPEYQERGPPPAYQEPAPPTIYQQRGPIINNTGNYFQHVQSPQATPALNVPTTVSSLINEIPRNIEVSIENPANRQLPLYGIDERSTNVGISLENSVNRQLPPSNSVNPLERYYRNEVLRLDNSNSTSSEKRIRLSDPPSLYHDPLRGGIYLPPWTPVPVTRSEMPPLKRDAQTKTKKGTTETVTNIQQPHQPYNVPSNYTSLAMRLNQPRPAMFSGYIPQPNAMRHIPPAHIRPGYYRESLFSNYKV